MFSLKANHLPLKLDIYELIKYLAISESAK